MSDFNHKAELCSQSWHFGPSTRKPHEWTDTGHWLLRSGIPSMSLSVETFVYPVVKVRSARRGQHKRLAQMERRLNVACIAVCAVAFAVDAGMQLQ